MYQSALVILTKPLHSRLFNLQPFFEQVFRYAKTDLFVFLQPGLQLNAITEEVAPLKASYTKCMRKNLSKIYHLAAMESSLNTRILLSNVANTDAPSGQLSAKFDVIFVDQAVSEPKVASAKMYVKNTVKNSFEGEVCFGCIDAECDGERLDDGDAPLKTYSHVCGGGTFDRSVECVAMCYLVFLRVY